MTEKDEVEVATEEIVVEVGRGIDTKRIEIGKRNENLLVSGRSKTTIMA